MADGATIDPRALHLQIGAAVINQGRPKGQWLSISFNNVPFSVVDGVDEEGYYIFQGSRSAVVEISLLQTSRLNDVLSLMHKADRDAPGGLLLPMTMKETNGTTVYSAAGCRLAGFPEAAIWSDGGEVRIWRALTTNLICHLGGVGVTPRNESPPS